MTSLQVPLFCICEASAVQLSRFHLWGVSVAVLAVA